MRLTAILLRVVLCLSLVLNGSGNALAAMHAMQPASAATQDNHDMHAGSTRVADSMVQVADMDSDCHAVQLAAMHHGNPAGDPPSKPDCCTSGACQGDCMLHSAAVPTAWSTRVVVIAQVAPGASMRSGHAAPNLPGEIRPPIG